MSSERRAILLDLDDTLFPEAAWRASGFGAVAAYVASIVDRSQEDVVAHLNKLDASGDRTTVIDRLLDADPEIATRAQPSTLIDVFRTHQPARLEVFPGVLRALGSWECATAIVTDGPWESQASKIRATGLRQHVDAVVLTDLLAPKRAGWKPSTLSFEVGLRCLETEPHNAMYIGDNAAKDFVGPNALGMQSIWLDQPGSAHAGRPAHENQEPTWRAVDWDDVCAHVEEWLW